MLNPILKTVRRLLLPTLICMMMLTACVSVKDDISKKIINTLQKEDLINLGDLEFEDYSKKKFDITNGNPEYIYDTEYGTCEIELHQYKKNHDTYISAYVVSKSERNFELQQYFTFKKKSSGKFKYTDGYIRSFDYYCDDDKYGLRSLSLYDGNIYLLFKTEQIEKTKSPIADYLKTYEGTGGLPNIELSLDGQTVELKETKISNWSDTASINVSIDFDAEDFLSIDYLKIGDMYWEFEPCK